MTRGAVAMLGPLTTWTALLSLRSPAPALPAASSGFRLAPCRRHRDCELGLLCCDYVLFRACCSDRELIPVLVPRAGGPRVVRPARFSR